MKHCLFLILEVELNRYCFQVGENVLNYQVDRYARTKGIDPERMTADQRVSFMDAMIRENYPGNNVINFWGFHVDQTRKIQQ